jgi:hypothetical protein
VVSNRLSILEIGFGTTMILFGAGVGAVLLAMSYRIATGGGCGF